MNSPFIAPLVRFICCTTCMYCLVTLCNSTNDVEVTFLVGYVLLIALMFVEPIGELEVIGYFIFIFFGGVSFLLISAFDFTGGIGGPFLG